MLFYITINMNKIYSKIPCFVKKNPKTTIEICGISKQNLWFFTTSIYNSSHYSNFLCLRNPLVFQNFHLLNNPQSFHHDKNQQEFKIQTKKVSLISPYPKYLICRNPTLAKCGGEAQHLEKVRIWSPPGLPNVQSSTARPKTS